MKPPLPKSLKIGLLVAVPLVLFLVARERASWRPRKVAGLPYSGDVTISADDRFVVNSDTEGGTITVRDLSSGEEVRHNGISRRVLSQVLSADGRKLAVAWLVPVDEKPEHTTSRLGVGVWDFEGDYRNLQMAPDGVMFDSPAQIRFSPDGKTLWLASSGNLRSWDVASGKLTWQWIKGEMGRDSSLPFFSALSADCRDYFRSDGEGYTVFDVSRRKRILKTKLPFLYDEDLTFSPDAAFATYIASEPNRETHRVIEARTGKTLWKNGREVVFSGDWAITSDKDVFEVREVRSGKLLRRLPKSPGAEVVPSTSSSWLYSLGPQSELIRQRLR